MSEKTIKAWLPVSLKGEIAASVDGIKLGYGKKEAKKVSESQLKRLKESTPEVEAGTTGGTRKTKKTN